MKHDAMQKIKSDNARGIALKVISAVLNDGAYSNIALNKELRMAQLDDLNRRFVTELVYGTVKSVGTLDWYLQALVNRPLKSLDRLVLNILRLGMYQIIYLERVPNSAACNEATELAKRLLHEGAGKFVNGVLRNAVRKLEQGGFVLPDAQNDSLAYYSVTQLHPQWLLKRWFKQFGVDEAVALCKYDNLPPKLSVRVNTLKYSRDEVTTLLSDNGCEVTNSAWSIEGVLCNGLGSLTKFVANHPDLCYFQDESSMLVAHILAPHPGATVIDVCAAPGGKATHMAQLMQNKGQIIACDIHEHKLKLINENAQRLGINIINTVLQDGRILQEEWLATADYVLVDAPCSGLGVLGRRAEARWCKTKKDLKEFPPLQRQILKTAAAYVKPGGYLAYSTCTLEQAENHYIPAEFLDNNPEWEYAGFRHPLTGEQVDELQLLPQKDGIDGFYITLLHRKEKH